MSVHYPKILRSVIDELKKLPGIGQKGAERLAFFLIKRDEQKVLQLADALVKLKKQVKVCSVCNTLCEHDPCEVCSSASRDKSTVCVVEESNDMFFIEKVGDYRGLYHVLQGAISPAHGVGPSELKVESLVQRCLSSEIKEVIIATNPNMDGETTALYLHRLIARDGLKVSRIARGIPVGGELEYVDEVTLLKAIQGRTLLS